MAFKTINTQDKNLQLIQDAILQSLAPLQLSPLTGGVMLSNVSIASGSNQIPHKLGKVPSKWIVTDITGGASTFYRTSWDSRFINLTASGACVASFWVS